MQILTPPYGNKTTIVDRIVSVFSNFAMLLILVGVSITLYEIVMRYIFESATTWGLQNYPLARCRHLPGLRHTRDAAA